MESGIVLERDSKGVIPESDLTPHEPDLSKLTDKEIATMVALQLKTLGYTNYAANNPKM